MFYYNKNVAEDIKNQVEEFNKNDLFNIRNFLNQSNLNFVSIKESEDGGIEFLNNNDYILLGPCGGVYDTKGKYSIFSADNDDGVIDTLNADIKNILINSNNFDVLNIG